MEREDQQRARETRMDQLNRALMKGLADADAGRTMSLDQAFKKLKVELELLQKDQC